MYVSNAVSGKHTYVFFSSKGRKRRKRRVGAFDGGGVEKYLPRDHPDAALWAFDKTLPKRESTKKKHQAVTRLRDTRASRGSRGVLRRDRGRVRAYLAVVPRRGVVLLPLERLRRVRVPLGHGVPRLLGLLGRALTKVPARISRGRAGSGPHPPRERASTPREKSPRVRDRRTTSAGSRRKGPRRARARWRNGVVFAVVVVVVTGCHILLPKCGFDVS